MGYQRYQLAVVVVVVAAVIKYCDRFGTIVHNTCIIIHSTYITTAHSIFNRETMLKDYEEAILSSLYDNGIIAMRYCSIQKAASIIKWHEISQKYRVKKKFPNVLWNLRTKGYVDFHGKSGDVVSLSRIGVAYVKGKSQR